MMSISEQEVDSLKTQTRWLQAELKEFHRDMREIKEDLQGLKGSVQMLVEIIKGDGVENVGLAGRMKANETAIQTALRLAMISLVLSLMTIIGSAMMLGVLAYLARGG